MHRFGLMLVLSVWVRPAASIETPRQNPLIGTWLLVRYVDTPEHGTPIYAFGNKPVGYFIFTAGGHVANSTWITHVTGTNIPAYLATDQSRHLRIDGDRLIIAETYMQGSTRINAEREFIREADAR